MSEGRGFAFDAEDFEILDAIDEDEEEKGDEATTVDVSEHDLAASKARTKTLAAAAKGRMEELGELLDKLNTGTATRAEKKRIEKVNDKLDDLKKEIEASELTFLKSKTRAKTLGVMKAVREKEVWSVIRAVVAAESVDLAFVIDCTGSMSSYINAVKSNVKSIVQQVKRTNGNLKLRLAVVGYRDIGDHNRFEILDFVSSIPKFEAYVGALEARTLPRTWRGLSRRRMSSAGHRQVALFSLLPTLPVMVESITTMTTISLWNSRNRYCSQTSQSRG